ncbi:hypothetical protein [Mucilaginibacter sp.]
MVKQLSYNISLSRYQLHEYLALYDEHTGVERILFYRLGWSVFFGNSKSFNQFASFLNSRIRLKNYLFSIPFYFLISIIIALLIVFNHQINWVAIVFGLGFSLALLWIRYYLLSRAENNGLQTKEFLTFIDPEKKKGNFFYFESLDINDYESAKVLYQQLLRKEDIPVFAPEVNAEMDKTIKLLALDFLLGAPGAMQEWVNKLQASSDSKLSKAGIYKVLGKILGASSDNVKAMIEKDLLTIRSTEPSSPRAKQLLAVKNIFVDANLPLVANEVDKVVKENRP